MNGNSFKIIKAESKGDIETAKKLFIEYAESLDIPLCFQDFDNELALLPGDYQPPTGFLLLLISKSEHAGCVALRKFDGDICEMKRLYVKPRYRGKGFGRKLTLAVIYEAKKMGYRFMRLDTVPSMKEAIKLYESLGFKKITPYRNNPIEGAIFMEMML